MAQTAHNETTFVPEGNPGSDAANGATAHVASDTAPKRGRGPGRQYVEPRVLAKRVAARYLGISAAALDRLVMDGEIRPLNYPGIRKDVFDRVALDALIERSAAVVATVPTTVPTSGAKMGHFASKLGLKRRVSR